MDKQIANVTTSGKEHRGEHPLRRMLEGTIATVTGGLILWWVTVPASQPARPQARPPAVAQSAEPQPTPIQPAAISIDPSFSAAEARPAPPMAANATITALRVPVEAYAPPENGPSVSTMAVMPRSAVTIATPMNSVRPVVPLTGSILFYEDFLHHREGDAPDWGQNALVRAGADHRKWLLPYSDAAHPVGRSIRLPNQFYFECRYATSMSDVTRGIFGWWKEPLSITVSLVDEKRLKYSIAWTIGCGNDPMKLDLHGPSLYAKRYFHTITPPGGAPSEVAVSQPTGMFRIDRENGAIKVFVDGQLAATATNGPQGQLLGFEINVVKAKTGTLFFTDFKIAQ